MIVGYWLLTGMCLLLIVCLWIVAHQRDTAQARAATYLAELAPYRSNAARLKATGRCVTCGASR